MASKNKTQQKGRRDFIKKVGIAGSAFTIVPRFVMGGPGHIAPSDTLYIAGIGVGGKGRSDLANFVESPAAKVVYLCDVDEPRAKESRTKFPDAKFYVDYREMLDKHEKDIDAVSVSTPDHSHAKAALNAMNRGKHVYVQKPLTWSMEEARMLTDAAAKNKVVTQMGNQGGSGDGVRESMEIYNAGLIGDVFEVHSWTNRPVWPQGLEKSTEKHKIPAGLDYDKWLGPAAFTPYQPVYVPFGWRGWYEFGTGALGDMACHMLDPAFRILPIDYASEVECSVAQIRDGRGLRYTPDCFPTASTIHFKFPRTDGKGDVQLHWYDGGIMPERPAELRASEPFGNSDGGILLVGTRGKLLMDCYGANPRLLPTTLMNTIEVKKTLPRVPEGHYVQWVNACIAGYEDGVTSSPFKYAGPFTEAILLGSLALRAFQTKDDNGRFSGQKKLLWDAKNLKVTNYDFANKFVRREYREGWELV
ncbi:MAG: Gfo/Idh/MocA family protein [Bacteroidota bacterium]